MAVSKLFRWYLFLRFSFEKIVIFYSKAWVI